MALTRTKNKRKKFAQYSRLILKCKELLNKFLKLKCAPFGEQ